MSSRSWVAFLPTSAERIALWAPPGKGPASPTLIQEMIRDALKLLMWVAGELEKVGGDLETAASDVSSTIDSALKTAASDVQSGLSKVEKAVDSAAKTAWDDTFGRL